MSRYRPRQSRHTGTSESSATSRCRCTSGRSSPSTAWWWASTRRTILRDRLASLPSRRLQKASCPFHRMTGGRSPGSRSNRARTWCSHPRCRPWNRPGHPSCPTSCNVEPLTRCRSSRPSCRRRSNLPSPTNRQNQNRLQNRNCLPSLMRPMSRKSLPFQRPLRNPTRRPYLRRMRRPFHLCLLQRFRRRMRRCRHPRQPRQCPTHRILRPGLHLRCPQHRLRLPRQRSPNRHRHRFPLLKWSRSVPLGRPSSRA